MKLNTYADIMRVLPSLPVRDRAKCIMDTLSVLPKRDIMALCTMVFSWSREYLQLRAPSASKLVKAFLDQPEVPYSYSAYVKMYLLLKFFAVQNNFRRNITVLRNVIERLFAHKGAEAWMCADVPSFITLALVFSTRKSLSTMTTIMPSAHEFLSMHDKLWTHQLTSVIAMQFFDTCARMAWGLLPRSADGTQTCDICYETKSSVLFVRTSCPVQHSMCFVCTRQLMNDSGVIKCPFRCGKEIVAVPLAIHEYLLFERQGLCQSVRAHRMVDVHAGQYVKVKLSPNCAVWSKVHYVYGKTLVISADVYSTQLLCRDDVVLAVADVQPETVLLTDSDIEDIAASCLYTLTLHDAAGYLMHLTPTHEGLFFESSHTGNIDNFDGSQLSDPKPLSDWWTELRDTHTILPTSTSSFCSCSDQIMLQLCQCCNKYVCILCFGSIFKICQRCLEIDRASLLS